MFLSLLILFSCKDKKEKEIVAEVSCGQCQFNHTDQKGCDLAVKIDGKAYFVDGVQIYDFGDAHEKTRGFVK
jgi:hypothetical protein